ncbi:succinate dehydrogenase, hydrophobic membrane anchor protein [Faunimonas sp. B44]|uniref:succinate dehydrogenase, hydrophobic membrane anchor protein n=1 Tax=Faunimonas sp. B44 TaxID=3461493 RepID=UPI004044797B
MRTALGQVRGLGSAKAGTGHFIAQRLTSVTGAILITAFVILVISVNGDSYEEVRRTLASPLVTVLVLGAVISTVVHMRIGMQIIIEDYVHGELAKVALLAANWIFAWAIGLTCIVAILKIAFGD